MDNKKLLIYYVHYFTGAFERHDVVEEYNGNDLLLGRALRDQLARRLALQLPA